MDKTYGFIALMLVNTGCGSAVATVIPEARPGAGAAVDGAHEFKSIEPAALWQKMQSAEQVFVVDNNRPETYNVAHVPGAVAMLAKDVTEDKLPSDKGVMLVFYCANEH